MAELHDVPLKVGQLAEERSFLSGYRGAWFRCKIAMKQLGIRCAVEYYDFPDDKIRWTKLYQKPNRSKKGETQIMLRPHFPPVYRESQMPDANAISEVVVIVNDVWKVGDLVDWWTDGCYWSGRLIEVLQKEKFRIQLHPPPLGEGQCYEVSCNDLRPSLDWSPEHGWTVPVFKENENHSSCARLIKPVNQVGLATSMVHAVHEGKKDIQATAGQLLKNNSSSSSHLSSGSLPPIDKPEQTEKRLLRTPALEDVRCNSVHETTCSDSVLCSHARDASVEEERITEGEDSQHHKDSSKNTRTDGSIPLNTMYSNTVESAIWDFEELVNRVKWIKSMLEFGMPLSDTAQPSWKFLEHRAPSSK